MALRYLLDPETVRIGNVQAKFASKLEESRPGLEVTCLVDNYGCEHSSTGSILLRGDLTQEEEEAPVGWQE